MRRRPHCHERPPPRRQRPGGGLASPPAPRPRRGVPPTTGGHFNLAFRAKAVVAVGLAAVTVLRFSESRARLAPSATLVAAITAAAALVSREWGGPPPPPAAAVGDVVAAKRARRGRGACVAVSLRGGATEVGAAVSAGRRGRRNPHRGEEVGGCSLRSRGGKNRRQGGVDARAGKPVAAGAADATSWRRGPTFAALQLQRRGAEAGAAAPPAVVPPAGSIQRAGEAPASPPFRASRSRGGGGGDGGFRPPRCRSAANPQRCARQGAAGDSGDGGDGGAGWQGCTSGRRQMRHPPFPHPPSDYGSWGTPDTPDGGGEKAVAPPRRLLAPSLSF